MEFQQTIIVEGHSDTQNLQNIFGPNIKTIETGGSSIDEAILHRISKMDSSQLIIFTDPDVQGERIRKIISIVAPCAKHAFLKKDESRPEKNNGTLGIEHATAEVIKNALNNLLSPSDTNESPVTLNDLRHLKLVDFPESSKKRQEVSEELNIGYTNGKQFLKRLNLFHITLEELESTLAKLK
jgi:ribonuclease M5